MKRAMSVIGILFLAGGLMLPGCVQNGQLAFEPVKVDVNHTHTSDAPAGTIQRIMEVYSPELEFSAYCRIYEDQGYIKVSSISSYSSEDLWSDLHLLRLKGIKKATIYMNSPGGSAFQGLAITDEFRLAKGDIELTCEGRGLIASAAVPVFLIADKRIVSKHTIFMIHPAKVWKWGLFTEGLEELESQAKMIRMLQDGYAESVANSTNLSKTEVLDMMQRDNWFTAEQALKMGFVDEIR